MLDDLKRHPEKIPLYLVVGIVALIGWPYTLALACCVGVVVVLMDEVLHAPRWATALAVNVMFFAFLFLIFYWTGLNPSIGEDVQTCSKPGC